MKRIYLALLLAAAPVFGSADFSWTPTAPQAGQLVAFIDQASVGPIPKNRWLWDFGDGGSSTEPNPKHTFTKPGTYAVKFSVWYANPEAQSITKSVTVTPAEALQAQFEMTRFPVAKEPVTFINRSTGAPTSSLWNFGDGTSATTQHATHVYERPGSYVVTLTVSRGLSPREESTTSRTILVALSGAARVVVVSPPSGMIQRVGEATAVDSFTIANIGSTAAELTLRTEANFFTFSPAALTLQPRTKATVVIRALARPGGAYDGAVVIASATGTIAVRIRLLSAVPGIGRVIAQAVRSRIETSAPPGENPTGAISFRNRGDGNLQAVVLSDVPWITPQSGLINIAPGETAPVRFTIDRSKRADGGAVVGSAAGKVSLLFFRGTAGKMAVGPNSTTPPASVSVTLVDVVKPPTSSGTPPSLTPGEMAIFIPGVSSKDGAIGDLHISSGSAPSSDLKMYFLSSNSAQVANVPPPAQNTGISLAAVATTVFGSESATGAVQVRGAEIQQLDVGALHLVNSSEGTYGMSLPVFRNASSTGAADGQFLSGVQKTADKQTDIHIQEVGGFAAEASIAYFDSEGRASKGSTSHSLAAFGFLELTDVIDSSTSMVRITSNSTNGARIIAFANVIDAVTNDGHSISDPAVFTASPLTTALIPVLPPPGAAGAAQTDLFITNRSNTSGMSVTVKSTSVAGRRRSVRSGSPIGGGASTERTFTIAPSATLQIADVMQTVGSSSDSTGILTISSLTPFSASAHTSAAASTGGAIGSALPVLATGAGLVTGESKRFAGVDAASAVTINNLTGGTFRTNAAFLETANQSARIRLTLHYSFAAGLTEASSSATREYSLSPRQLLVVHDLAGALIGEERDSFGDLRDMQLQVEVIEGSGAVVPIVQSLDNQSGDPFVRID